jgi:serine/threonine protein kinase
VTPERWQQVERAYHAALAADPAARAALLDEVCAGDEALRLEVTALLEHQPAAEKFLAEPAIAVAARALTGDVDSIAAGSQFGTYRILGALGAGGMGVVYRARDTQLERDVAIKVLPSQFTADPERRARFAREARLLATLNHPNIGAIYGLQESGTLTGLVLELVQGRTLAQRLEHRPLSVPQALAIAGQIADALEAAHRKHIIHRDLKPANIVLQGSGDRLSGEARVKVLDFGLGKSIVGDAEDEATRQPATMSAGSVGARIVGTPAYMSPEQARGEVVDHRTDIWAFGCVLYEMLAGRRAFDGKTITDTLAAVLERAPDWGALPPSIPAPILALLRQCLQKDPRRRLHDIADARIQIDDALTAPAETSSATASRPAALTIASMVGGALVSALAMWLLTRPAPQDSAPLARWSINASPALPPAKGSHSIAIAPDGSFIAYVVGAGKNQGRLVVRWRDRTEPTPIAGVSAATNLFVSPDSRWIGYVEISTFTLRKVAVTGGPPITLARLPGVPIGASWLDDSTAIIATNKGTTGLLRVAAGSAEPTGITELDDNHGELGHWHPSVLPGGRAVLFTIVAARPAVPQIAVVDLQTGRCTTLIQGGSDAHYVASGHLVYAWEGGLSAVRFDLKRLAVVGNAVRVLDGVVVDDSGGATAALTPTGTLVYVPGESPVVGPRSLVWVDRHGKEISIGAPPRAYVGPRLSPDGTRVAVEIRDQENDIWVWDLGRSAIRRLTDDPSIDRGPVWTPDSHQIVFASSRTGFGLYSRAADGSGVDVRLTAGTDSQYATSITQDATTIIGYELRLRTGFDLVRFPFHPDPGAHGAPMPTGEKVFETPSHERNGELSPNGRFVAYQADKSGRYEIYVRPYPLVETGLWQITTGGGSCPEWTRDGRELLYLNEDQRLSAVPVDTTGSTLVVGTPAILLTTSYASPFAWRPYDVSLDGKRFLMIKHAAGATEAAPPQSLVIVQNWTEDLKRLLPVN